MLDHHGGPALKQRRSRWPNIKTTLVRRLVFAGQRDGHQQCVEISVALPTICQILGQRPSLSHCGLVIWFYGIRGDTGLVDCYITEMINGPGSG